jgi:hypothetical protein
MRQEDEAVELPFQSESLRAKLPIYVLELIDFLRLTRTCTEVYFVVTFAVKIKTAPLMQRIGVDLVAQFPGQSEKIDAAIRLNDRINRKGRRTKRVRDMSKQFVTQQ